MSFHLRFGLALLTSTLFLLMASFAVADEIGWEQLPGGVLASVRNLTGPAESRSRATCGNRRGLARFRWLSLFTAVAPRQNPCKPPATTNCPRCGLTKRRGPARLGRANNPPIPDLLAEGWAVYRSTSAQPPLHARSAGMGRHALAVSKARSLAFVDSHRIAMVGGSHGGHVTAAWCRA